MKAAHRFAEDKKSGEGEGGAIARHSGEQMKLAKGEGSNFPEESFQLGQGKREAIQPAGFSISAGKKTCVGMAGSA
jgi:hypothetical protein